MLNNVSVQVNKANRMATLRHPNAADCTVLRKTVNRVSTDDPEEFSGLPTIGGLGVLDSEDEANYDYEEIGEGKIVMMGQFQTNGGNWNDADDGLLYPEQPMIEGMIECILKPEEAGFFVASKHDVVLVDMGVGIVIPYQIVGETGSIALPPYTKRYILQARHDDTTGI
jgi:hypothetical protein